MGPIALERRTGFTWATKLPAPRSLPSFPLWKPADVWTSSSANTWATSCPNSELGPSTELENSLPPPGNLRAVSDTHSVLSPRAAANRRPSSDGYNRLVFATMEGESPVAPLRNHSQNTEDEVGRISFSAEGVGRCGRALSHSRGRLGGSRALPCWAFARWVEYPSGYTPELAPSPKAKRLLANLGIDGESFTQDRRRQRVRSKQLTLTQLPRSRAHL